MAGTVTFEGFCPPKTTPERGGGVELAEANRKSVDKKVSLLGHRAAGKLVESE